MDIKISILDIVIFLGILQAITAIVIGVVSKKNIVARLFCLLLFFFLLIIFKIQLHTLNLWEKIPYFRYFPLAIDLVLQPTFYLYFLSVSGINFSFKKKQLLHYLPALLFMLHALIVYFSVLGVNDLAQKAGIAEKFYYNAVKEIEDYLSVISFFVYFYLCYKTLNVQAKEKVEATKDELKRKWLKSIVGLFFILSVLLALCVVLETVFKLGEHTFLHWGIFYTYLSGFLYYISITSIRLPEIVILPISPIAKKVDKDKVVLIAGKIKEIVEQEKLYQNADLSIQELAKKMNVSTSTLSYVINTHYKSTYRDFINEYRINAVKEMLLNSSKQNLSILGIAMEMGFSSEASFYRIFKSKVGVSPKEFRDQESLKKNAG